LSNEFSCFNWFRKDLIGIDNTFSDEFSCCDLCRKDLIPFEKAKIVFIDEVFAIEKPGSQLNLHSLTSGNAEADAQHPLSK